MPDSDSETPTRGSSVDGPEGQLIVVKSADQKVPLSALLLVVWKVHQVWCYGQNGGSPVGGPEGHLVAVQSEDQKARLAA